jgi:predicted DNA-binding protein with PD1-like motif
MKYKKFDNTYVVRIEKDEEVINKITDLCKKENIKLGSITGIGATDKLVIGLFDTNLKQYHKTTLTGPMEITSLMGNISTKDGETYLHLHINVCNSDMQVYGGHLNECYISATCELHIIKIDGEVDRYFDESIGLNLYKL